MPSCISTILRAMNSIFELLVDDCCDKSTIKIGSEMVCKPLLEEEEDTASSTSMLRYPSDLILVLDMDQSLIHDISYPNVPDESSDDTDSFLLEKYTKEDPNFPSYRRILMRPGLIGFLRAVMTRYETHIFTASSPGHADPILNELELRVGRKFQGRWYRHDCTYREGVYLKDLETLPGRDLRRMVLVDNNPTIFEANPENAVPVRDFHGDAKDTTLFSVYELLRLLEDEKDVRPFLCHRFAVKTGFENMRRMQKRSELYDVVKPRQL